ncbi:histidine phosphatase family protein [Actinotalea fermentans]|uniref:Isomerase n=1 Tax=Actinotalea fermentans TaxID=43671 RepID=A0A511Z2D2_9CELL|nr:histidine phosphatase family protein [Actinotalea fermentans]GEN81556.1 isomerase [Actinotalea fermentans]
MRLILVRHGQTTANVAGLLDTAHPGAHLTDLGHEQAAALPAVLDGATIDALYASSLVRTQQTAAPLAAARGLDVQVRDGLREISAGDLEMLGDAASVERYLATSLAWVAGDHDAALPGGETAPEVLARFDDVVTEAAASGAETVVMVSHGTVIRSWAAIRAGIPADEAARSRLGNTDVVVLEGHPAEGWRALSWAGRSLS